jgi:hypothetical protein
VGKRFTGGTGSTANWVKISYSLRIIVRVRISGGLKSVRLFKGEILLEGNAKRCGGLVLNGLAKLG